MASTLTLANGNTVDLLVNTNARTTSVRTRDANGNVISVVEVGGISRATSGSTFVSVDYDLQLSDDGGFTLLFTSDVTSRDIFNNPQYNHGFRAWVFNVFGVTVNTTAALSGDNTQLIALPGGGFLLTSMDKPSNDQSNIYPSFGQFYDRFGNVVGSRFATTFAAQDPIVVNPDGSVSSPGHPETYTEFSTSVEAPAGGGTVNGGTGMDFLRGQSGNDQLYGGGGNDVLYGNAGNDILVGNAGADVMRGGAGDDLYGVEETGDVVVELTGEGNDTVQTSLSQYTLGANVENLWVVTNGALGTGNALANTMIAGGVGSWLSGLGGNDTLNGGTGSDVLDGGTGDDTMAGGAGDDYYFVDSANDIVVEAAGQGYDTVYLLNNYTLPQTSAVEVIILMGTVTSAVGSNTDNTMVGNASANSLVGLDGNDYLQGGGGNDILIGGAGNDLIDGGTGADSMGGGTGNDSYLIDDDGDVVSEFAGEGFDTVYTTRSLTLTGGNAIELILLQDGALDFTGNELDNHVVGNGAANNLIGAGGNDYVEGGAGVDSLSGGSGDDLLDGGIGADTMNGGTGNDTFFVDNIGDVVLETIGQGYDTVYSSADITLSAQSEVELLYLTGAATSATGSETNNIIVGNALANTLVGGGGADYLQGGGGDDQLFGGTGDDLLSGGAGNDTLTGGAGNDTYLIDDAGDVVVEASGDGYDTLYVSFDYTLAANADVELIQFGGAPGSRFTGSNTANTIYALGAGSIVDGGGGNDTLLGNSGANTLIGGAGNDWLQGYGGADTLTGGGDADTFYLGKPFGGAAAPTLTDFNRGEGDRLLLSATEFGQSPGGLGSVRFDQAAAASGTGPQIFYNSASGQLWYDADGAGGADSVLIGLLGNRGPLLASDIGFL